MSAHIEILPGSDVVRLHIHPNRLDETTIQGLSKILWQIKHQWDILNLPNIAVRVDGEVAGLLIGPEKFHVVIGGQIRDFPHRADWMLESLELLAKRRQVSKWPGVTYHRKKDAQRQSDKVLIRCRFPGTTPALLVVAEYAPLYEAVKQAVQTETQS